MRAVKILVFSGSTRSGSFNGKLAGAVLRELALGDAQATRISLSDFPLPLYDGDLEQTKGVPEAAHKLKRIIQSHDGVFIACPEYNAGVTPLLKNTLDWVSRISDPGEPASAAFKQNRVFAIGSASPGAMGGVRGLMSMRTILEMGLGALVIPQTVIVSSAASAFDAKGDLADERSASLLKAMVQALIRQARFQLG
ncbi:NADPH-dependent FMN reductase [Roseibium suaedae]|uniref:NAD(P)H-dependent FMN reductase n=1 Tax=Roseibium suaedae TaxID=735517 RepID=A0A1M6Z142_9HYPH|nr:NAD(P)H-dependent oxidoreductase [Roseibium suaedae]SHL24103.1 NAD(P)H-dependent FMN reductase [Roseibium suaedae]